MQNTQHEATWKIYQDAWADISADTRKQLISESVAEGCHFADPNSELASVGALIAHIEEFQKAYPGAYFVTHKFMEHHGQSIAEWMMYAKDGSEFLPGTSVARYGADGRLTDLAGYWKL